MRRRKKVRITISWEKIKEVLEKTREQELEEVRKILESPSPLLLEFFKLAKEGGDKKDERGE